MLIRTWSQINEPQTSIKYPSCWVFLSEPTTCWWTSYDPPLFLLLRLYFDLIPPLPHPHRLIHRFAGRTVTSGSLVLVTVATKEDGAAQLTVNCEKMLIGTMLVKDVLLALTQWSPLTPTPKYRQRLVTPVAPPLFSCKRRATFLNVKCLFCWGALCF